MRASDFIKQNVAEGFEEKAQEYKSYLLKTLPQMMLFLKGVRGAPSEKQMLAAIDVAYDVMKRTGDIKQAAKANKDALDRMIDQQDVAEGDARPENFTKNGLTWTLEHLGSIDGKDLGAGGLVDIFKGYQDINNKEKFRWFIRGQRTGVLRPVSSEHTAIRKFLHPSVANNNEYKKFTEQSVAEAVNLDEGIMDFISKAKDKFLRLKDALSDEWAQTKEMWRIAQKGNKASPKEIKFANSQFKDILRVVGLASWYSLPIPGNTILILTTEKLLNKVGMSIIPDKIRNQVLMSKAQDVEEGKQQVERNGIQLNVSIDGATVDIRPMINGNQVGYVVFDRDGKTLVADDLAIDEEYRRRGIAKIIYDYLKELGFTVKRSTDQLPAGKAFWDKYKGAQGQVWEDEHVDEMALASYKTMGDFTKQGPFTGADKKLVPHHKNIEKATQFFEQTPYDFRLFFSNIPGTGKWSEHGPMTPDELRKVFGKDAEEIINGSSDAITVVYVGNKGDRKVMLTPWMMAHRFGHALNRGAYKMGGSGAWKEAERHFFRTVNSLLNDYYGKIGRSPQDVKYELTPEYNSLFNAVGTQRSSRSGEIRRPYEFFYELFAQYLGTGQITLNPFPTNLTYGRKAWGNPTRFMNIKPEYRDEAERKYAAEVLGRDMEILFDDVLSSSVGQIYVM